MAINIKYPLRDIISLSSFDRAITKKLPSVLIILKQNDHFILKPSLSAIIKTIRDHFSFYRWFNKIINEV